MNVKRLVENAYLPMRATFGSAGLDLHASAPAVIQPGTSEIVSTGIALEIPENHFGLVVHRSSLAFKLGVVASPGIIDSDYRGEIKVCLFNLGDETAAILEGDRFAQIIIIPFIQVTTISVEEMSKTFRGEGGFGSTN
jgi:dUTP pyrophosphatase